MGESPEISHGLEEQLQKSPWEKSSDEHKGTGNKAKWEIPPLVTVMKDLPQEKIRDNLANDIVDDGSDPKLHAQTLEVVSGRIDKVRRNIRATLSRGEQELKEAKEQKAPEERLKALQRVLERQQLEATHQIAIMQKRIEEFQRAWNNRAKNPERLRALLREPNNQAVIDLYALKAVREQFPRNKIFEKMQPAARKALIPPEVQTILEKNPQVAQMLDNPKKFADDPDRQRLVQFAEDFLGSGGKKGALDDIVNSIFVMQKSADFPVEERYAAQAELLATTALAAQILGVEESQYTQKISKLVEKDQDIKVPQDIKIRFQKRTDAVIEGEEGKEGIAVLTLPTILRTQVHNRQRAIMSGRSGDPQLDRLGKFVFANGAIEDDASVEEVYKLIQNIRHEAKDNPFSPAKLQQHAANWQRANLSDEEWQEGNRLKDLWQDGTLEHMAVYEMALKADDILKSQYPDVDFSRIDFQPHAFKSIAPQAAQLSPESYKDKGKLMQKLFSGEGALSFITMMLGGAIAALNIVASTQTGDWQNPYIPMGAAMAYAGHEGLERDYLDSLINPENRVLNELASLRDDKQERIISIFTNPREQALYRHLDLGKRGETVFNAIRKQEGVAQRELVKAASQAKKTGSEYTGKRALPKEEGFTRSFQFEIDPADLKKTEDGGTGKYLGILTNPDDPNTKNAVRNINESGTSGFDRYIAIRFLYEHNITNGDLETLFMHAKGFENVGY